MTQHKIAGRLNGVWPLLGTIVGPGDNDPTPLVVLGHDERGCVIGYASPLDLHAMMIRARAGDVRSVTEHRAVKA